MSDLPVGHPARRSAALALRVGFVVATVFPIVTIVSKEIAALNAPQPWQDDPYDVVVSSTSPSCRCWWSWAPSGLSCAAEINPYRRDE